jgi:hypothetical protein
LVAVAAAACPHDTLQPRIEHTVAPKNDALRPAGAACEVFVSDARAARAFVQIQIAELQVLPAASQLFKKVFKRKTK